MSSKRPTDAPTRSTDLDQMSRREFTEAAAGGAGLLAALVAAFSAGAYGALIEEEGGEDTNETENGHEENEASTDVDERPRYGSVTEVMNKERFYGPKDVSQRFDAFVATFRAIYQRTGSTAFYYNLSGEIIGKVEMPADWPYSSFKGKELARRNKNWPNSKKQAWHNENRIKFGGEDGLVIQPDYLSPGYPFASVPVAPGVEGKDVLSTSSVDIINERLDEKLSTPGGDYFDGEERTLREAIEEITTAYGVPTWIALGLGAQESGFLRKAKSGANAKGIYQFLDSTAKNQALPHVLEDPKDSSFRSIDLSSISTNNRFVQIELFCAHFNFLKEEIRPKIGELSARLTSLNPEYPAPDLVEVAAINSYNAGPDRIKRCIDKFLDLSDKEIKEKIGTAPYGLDAWLGLISNSYGTDSVGSHVFHYSLKVFAYGSLLQDEVNPMEKYMKERPYDPEFGLDDEPPIDRKEVAKWAAGSGAVSFGTSAVAAAALAAAIPKEEGRLSWLTRRGLVLSSVPFLGGFFATGTVPGTLLLRRITNHFRRKQRAKNEQPEPLQLDHETFERAMLTAKAKLDQMHKEMQQRRSFDYTQAEYKDRREFKIQKQVELLRDIFAEALGEAFKPREWRTADKRHREWKEAQIKSGSFVKMEEDNPSLPYFCQQVGRPSGHTDNNEEAMYMRKEFVPFMGSIVELVNHQIDIFNADPSKYGNEYRKFPRIPHITAIKISGAFRHLEHQYKTLGSMATKGYPSAHVIGHALDMGALTRVSEDVKVVRFAEDFTYQGKVEIPAGGKLSTAGFGEKTRVLLSRMIYKAIVALQEPLKEEYGITVEPLWENTPKNWHVTLRPAEQ